MNTPDNPYKAAFEREKKARLRAEQLLEDRTRELYIKNQELEHNYLQLKKQQALMLKNEKLATLGMLSAGIAHEINNPLAFVCSNVETLKIYQQSFAALYEHCLSLSSLLEKEQTDALSQLIEDKDLAYILKDTPELIAETQEGLSRVSSIVGNLRSFSRSQPSDRCSADLVEGIHSTLKILTGELKNHVTVNLDLKPLPLIWCNPTELNQVFLNLILNAKHATIDSDNPTIHIATHVQESSIFITISDNGYGMSPEVIDQVFVPFFTTKPVGEGTGMGLAIVNGIIEDHNGRIKVTSQEGKGTTFNIELPINSP